MKKILKGSLLILLGVGLVGCSTIHRHSAVFLKKRDNAYLKSHTGHTLHIPAGLSASKVGNEFSIPASRSHGAIPASTVTPYGVKVAQLSSTDVWVQDDSTGYPGLMLRLTPATTYSMLGEALGRSQFAVLKGSMGLNQYTIRSMTTGKSYQLYLIAARRVGAARSVPYTRVYITDGATKRLPPKKAEALAASIKNSLVKSKAYVNGESTTFLKPLF